MVSILIKLFLNKAVKSITYLSFDKEYDKKYKDLKKYLKSTLQDFNSYDKIPGTIIISCVEKVQSEIIRYKLKPEIVYHDLWESENESLQIIAAHLIPFFIKRYSEDSFRLLNSTFGLIQSHQVALACAIKFAESIGKNIEPWNIFLFKLAGSENPFTRRTSALILGLILVQKKSSITLFKGILDLLAVDENAKVRRSTEFALNHIGLMGKD